MQTNRNHISKKCLRKKYVVDISKLKKGDILLTTTNHLISRVIRLYTSSQISHAMIYVDFSSIIHATGIGVNADNTQRLLFDCPNHVMVYRHKHADQTQLEKVIQILRSKIGQPYSALKAIIYSTIKNVNIEKDEKTFCSMLLAQAFMNADAKIVDDIKCTPEDIRKSRALLEVTSPLRLITDEEIDILLNTTDKPFIQAHVISSINRNMNKKTKYTLDNLYEGINIDRNSDSMIANIFQKTTFECYGIKRTYLTLWHDHIIDNCYFYKDCEPLLKQIFIEGEHGERFTNMFLFFYKKYKEYNSKTYKLLASCYCVLFILETQKTDTKTDHPLEQILRFLIMVSTVCQVLIVLEESDDISFCMQGESIEKYINKTGEFPLPNSLSSYGLDVYFKKINRFMSDIKIKLLTTDKENLMPCVHALKEYLRSINLLELVKNISEKDLKFYFDFYKTRLRRTKKE